MKRIAVICISIAIAFGFAFLVSIQSARTPTPCSTDALLCPDGTAVGRIGPRCEFAPCLTPTAYETTEQIDAKRDLIVLESPPRDSVISSPVTITGKARGYWYFEASFPITIVNWDGLIIGEGIARAQSDWMTEDFVPFVATVTFHIPPDTPYHRGAIILKKDNPSGLPQNDDALEVPVLFK